MDWTAQELDKIIRDYFDMLRAELWSTPFSKAAHRRDLLEDLPSRSKGAIEFKHCNISAVLVAMRLPYVQGYQPRGNYQNLLAEKVAAYVENSSHLMKQFDTSPILTSDPPFQADSIDFDEVIEEPPARIEGIDQLPQHVSLKRARKIDFAERDALNRKLGERGEAFVVELERHRLKEFGRDDLAKRVIWASREVGDGLGYDILSFNEVTDTEVLVEVKSTNCGKFFPFYVSSREVACSEECPSQYQLHRVFDFGRKPRVYVLRGSLREHCRLDPVVYRATV